MSAAANWPFPLSNTNDLVSLLNWLYLQGQRDFPYSYLYEANLANAKLPSVNLSFSYLYKANLLGVDLMAANLGYSFFAYSYLGYANLSHAYLGCAYLAYSNLSYANLSFANLSHSDLSFADLSYADLTNADLSYADLSFVNLTGANLTNTKLTGVTIMGITLTNIQLVNTYFAHTQVIASGKFEVPANSEDGVALMNNSSRDASVNITPSGSWKNGPNKASFSSAGDATYAKAGMKHPQNTAFSLLAINPITNIVQEIYTPTVIAIKPGESLIFRMNDAPGAYGNNVGSITVNWSEVGR